MTLVASVIGLVLGTGLGLIAAGSPPLVGAILTRISDIGIALPSILIALVLATALGPGNLSVIIAISVWFVPVTARVVVGPARQVLALDFVEASATYGRGRVYALIVHVIPNIAPLLIVQASIMFAAGILAEAALSFLGVGAQPPTASWGRLLNEAQPLLQVAPFFVLIPGSLIVATVLGFNLLGDGLRVLLDPQQSTRGCRDAGPLLQIRDLRIRIGGRELVVLDELAIGVGERVGLVGESGSGKTLTVMSIMGLLPTMMAMTGSVRFQGQELLGMPERSLAHLRGRDIGMVFQDPSGSLNPTKRIGTQIAETLRLHTDLGRSEIKSRVLELMDRVHLPDPVKLFARYPHELSGGQQQRVMIASAIACRPKLLIADEPTTALDVTVQHRVLQLIRELSEEYGMALIFVSHNLGVVQSISDRIAVMRHGALVEIGAAEQVIRHPMHEYTKSLIAANPGIPDAEEFVRLAGTRFGAVREA